MKSVLFTPNLIAQQVEANPEWVKNVKTGEYRKWLTKNYTR